MHPNTNQHQSQHDQADRDQLAAELQDCEAFVLEAIENSEAARQAVVRAWTAGDLMKADVAIGNAVDAWIAHQLHFHNNDTTAIRAVWLSAPVLKVAA